MSDPEIILDFWFNEIDPAQWWRKDPAFDSQLKQRFGQLHHDVAFTGAHNWRDHANGRLAEVIVLDQFSRNLYRNDARAYAWDAVALQLTETAIARGVDTILPAPRRAFLYMPFMHSESLAHQQRSLELFAGIAETGNLNSAQRHFDVVQQFGRFPHRNIVLGRASTAAESVFLQQSGSRF